mgnify:FL=1
MLMHYTPQVRWNSLFDRAFEDFLPGRAVEASNEAVSFAPRVDIREGEDSLVLTAELPGVNKDAIKVEVKDRILTITGEKKTESEFDKDGIHRSERVYGSFQRSFTLPETLDSDKIDASYEDGVLKLVLNKRPEASPKQIPVQAGGTVKQIDTKN